LCHILEVAHNYGVNLYNSSYETMQLPNSPMPFTAPPVHNQLFERDEW